MNPIIIIPARGGSKGIPGKNIKLLNGKPLIYYTIDVAREILPDHHIIVSTDSICIKEVVEKTGLTVPFIRPSSLAEDNSTSYDVIIHTLEQVEATGYFPDTIILLQPTSPFRTSLHVKEALKLYSEAIDMVVSVKESNSNPYYNLFEENSGFLNKSKSGIFTRRQDCPKVWEFNGAIYIMNVNSLKLGDMAGFNKVRKYIMDEKSSLDLDTEIDWMLSEILFKQKDNS